jgi:hypothetical protein
MQLPDRVNALLGWSPHGRGDRTRTAGKQSVMRLRMYTLDAKAAAQRERPKRLAHPS